jgi:arylsulfatase A-like enzyme
MRPASLLVVFVLAKAAGLYGHHLPISAWSPIAYVWQDAAVVLVFAAIDAWLGPRERVAWSIYAVLAFYTAANVPVVRVLSTPLTGSMWLAARGTLADSIWLYATGTNVLLIVLVSAVACLAPLCVRRVSRPRILAPLVVGVALGPAAVAHVDTLGLERNAWTALAGSLMPHVAARAADSDWRGHGFDRTPSVDLSSFRGAAAGRSVVLVSLESTAAKYLGVYGATPDVMPHLSELARTAIVFDNAYAVYPESIKGLFSILCSTYPSFDSAAEMYAAVPCPSIAATLAGARYATALFHSGRFMYLGMEAIVRNRGYSRLEDAGDIGGNHHSSFGVDEPSTVARILGWIDGLPAEQPFFVTYLPIAGHHPYDTPEPGPFPEHDELGRYRNALHDGDAALGALVHGLEARGRQQNTLWIVLGDHGEAFGQHEGNFGHTFQLYDENVRVPFLVAAPGLVRTQIRSERIVSLIDTAPTALDLLGVPPPARSQGRSMLDDEPRVALFFADYSLAMLGLRDGRMKFIYELDSGRAKLFDVADDPDERRNIAALHPARAREYERRLRSWSAAQKQRLRTREIRNSGMATVYPPVPAAGLTVTLTCAFDQQHWKPPPPGPVLSLPSTRRM